MQCKDEQKETTSNIVYEYILIIALPRYSSTRSSHFMSFGIVELHLYLYTTGVFKLFSLRPKFHHQILTRPKADKNYQLRG